jgi:protein TonB
MMPAGRFKLLGPAASGALHAGLFGLIAGFGLGLTPPSPQPISVEVVLPEAPPAPSAPNALAEPAAPAVPAALEQELAPVAPPLAADIAAVSTVSTPTPIQPLPRPRPRPVTESGRTAPLEDLAAKLAPPASAAPPALAVPAHDAPGVASVAEGKPGEEGARQAVALAGNPSPAYPGVARRRGIEGQVLLRVAVDAAGRPTAVSLARSSGSALLDEAARDAVARWSFVPARVGGMPVAAEVDVPITFRLAETASR